MAMNKKNETNRTDAGRYPSVKPCAAQDCTGLIPAGPVGEEELEDYEELYPFLPQIPDGSRYKD